MTDEAHVAGQLSWIFTGSEVHTLPERFALIALRS